MSFPASQVQTSGKPSKTLVFDGHNVGDNGHTLADIVHVLPARIAPGTSTGLSALTKPVKVSERG